MADVSITIRKIVGGTDSTIMVSGKVDDAALTPFTTQLSSLLAAAASAVPDTSVSSVSSTSSGASA